MTIQPLYKQGIPALCIDTCSILDIMRDPTREAIRTHDRQATLDLLDAAESGQIQCFMPEQVAIEFASHDVAVQTEADRALTKVKQTLRRINEVAGIYATQTIVDLSHLDDHVVRARAIVARWLLQIQTVPTSTSAPIRAFARVNAGIAPAKRGKDSSKDCLIYETILEIAAAILANGGASSIVFLSSNTEEYTTAGSVLKAEIAAEFTPFNLTYAPNMSAAKYALGI